jgi:hypothetical protein
MKVGIIGSHGSGKSIIFKSLTGIEEEHRETSGAAVVEVIDERLDKLHSLYPDKKKIHTRLDIIDAGVYNSKDELIRKCDAYLLVVGAFFGERVEKVWNDIKADMIISDQDVIEKRLNLLKKEHKKENEREEKLLEKVLDIIKNEIRLIESEQVEDKLLKGFSLFTYKPVFAVINISEKQEEKDFLITKESLGIPSLVFKGKLEADLQDLEEEERGEYMELYAMKESAIDRVIKALYSEIGLITFFTTEGDEVRGWRLKEGSSILEAAGSIHTDMEKGFIKADVISVSELFNAGSEKEAREKGLIHLVGRDYIVKDGDVLKIRFA